MTEDSSGRFQPRPRRETQKRAENDAENFRAELLRIRRRTTAIVENGREQFAEGDPSYDVASMVIIRLAALLERPEFGDAAALLTPDELAAIRTTRNIAAHAGYGSMNDDLFWIAVTRRVPEIIRRLLEA
ncbi:antitoxin [Gulosibacter molinativorax]|uniref:Antitoxin n=1 Tax=Gulosibacter molinativorax TaxID=256821 RepID=A0ABT7C864_9MICO|nr:antitoxin [Gulosibacter molinativorax]MDJ1371374.1 antitoxin [Gulosibacter molinativorax]QUY62871.1 Hypotetical protein [Gulosibacter molinativorax]